MQDKVVNHDVKLDKWEIKNLYKDTLWVKMVDEPEADFIASKGGIILTASQKTRGFFRIGQVLKCGEDTKYAKEGQYILIPPQTGIIGFKSKEGYKTSFIKEDAVMAVIEFDGDDEQLQEHIQFDLKA